MLEQRVGENVPEPCLTGTGRAGAGRGSILGDFCPLPRTVVKYPDTGFHWEPETRGDWPGMRKGSCAEAVNRRPGLSTGNTPLSVSGGFGHGTEGPPVCSWGSEWMWDGARGRGGDMRGWGETPGGHGGDTEGTWGGESTPWPRPGRVREVKRPMHTMHTEGAGKAGLREGGREIGRGVTQETFPDLIYENSPEMKEGLNLQTKGIHWVPGTIDTLSATNSVC